MWKDLPELVAPGLGLQDHVVRHARRAAKLLAVGNGNPRDHSSYQTQERRAFHGLLLAMIQTTAEAGAVRVTAQADGLEPASIDIAVVPGEAPPQVH